MCARLTLQTFHSVCHKHGDAQHVDEDVHRFFLEERPQDLVPSTQHRCHIGNLDSPGFSKHLKITGGLPSENVECIRQGLARRIFLTRMMHGADTAVLAALSMAAIEYGLQTAFPAQEALQVRFTV